MKKIYLAIPYSGMTESSYKQATKATAELLKMEYNVFSPITHSHPLTKYDMPGTWEFWEKIDYQWIDACDEVWVFIPDEGIEPLIKSKGVNAEIAYAKKTNKPVRYINNEILELETFFNHE